jgi:hypothetical protein
MQADLPHTPLATTPPALNLPALAMPAAPTSGRAAPPELSAAREAWASLPETAVDTLTTSLPQFGDLPELSAAPVLSPAAPAAMTSAATSIGRPDAGPIQGADVATPPSAPASAARLNLQLPRSRGGELSRLGSGGLLAVLPRPPERKPRLEQALDSAAQPDCRTAHAQLGLLAVVPLALDALKADGGCRW